MWMTGKGSDSMESAIEQARLRVELEPVPQNVPLARDAASQFAQRVGADHPTVALAVSEAVSNVVMHAFRGKDPRAFRLEAAVEEGCLSVAVIDRGIGMTPNPASPGLGLGLALIGGLAEPVEIASSEEGTSIRMYFPLEAGGS